MQRLTRRTWTTAFLLALFTATPAYANSRTLQPYVTVDTTGIGAGASYALPQGNDVRVQATFSGTISSSGPGTYLLTGNPGSSPALLNLSLNQHVSGGGINFTFDHHMKNDKPFFISAGGEFNFIRIDVESVPTSSTISFGGATYPGTAAGTLGIHARWRALNPYLGFGWLSKNTDGSQHGPAFELGAFYIGKPTISFTTEGVVAANPAQVNPYLNSLRSKLSGDLGGLTVYPVLRVRIPIGK